MKTYFTLIATFLIFAQNLVAQCTYCTDIKSALTQPEIVETLDLRAKGLNDLPKEIKLFLNLKELNLSDNFIFEIDYKSLVLPKLEVLIINNNPGFFTANTSGITEAFPQLKTLELVGNKIKFLSAEIGKLTHLESLNLAHNSISILPEEIEKIPTLRKLNLANNNILPQDYFLSQLWNLEQLNLSNNDSLKTNTLMSSLLFKDKLEHLTVSLTPNSTFTKEINTLSIPFLEIVNSKDLKLPNSFRTNKHIQKIVFNNCTFSDPKASFSILNESPQLKVIEFRNMTVPDGFSNLKNITELHLNNAQVSNISDFQKLSPKTIVYQTNIKESITNSQELKNNYNLSPEMLLNDTPCIKDVITSVELMNSNESKFIALENSNYSIPENAFLNEDGTMYNGQVKVEIKEYLDPIINAIAGMPMMFSENGEATVFSSNGMIEFSATDNEGNKLIPNPENSIQVELIDLQPSENSDLFVFDQQSRNWNRIGQPVSSNRDDLLRAKIDSINRLLPNDLVNTKSIYPMITLNVKTKKKDPSIFEFKAEKHDKDELKNAPADHFYLSNKSALNIGTEKWEVDTLLTDELRKLLSDIRTSQRIALKYMKKDKKVSTRGLPRIITDVKITPDLAHDNFRMTFNFKGQIINLPVYQSIAKKPSAVQQEEAKDYAKYIQLRNDDNKEEIRVAKQKEQFIEQMAPIVRQGLINALNVANQSVPTLNNQDVLRFGLRSFGIVNCDYIFRNKPDDYLALGENAIDQDGKLIPVPQSVITILRRNKVSFSTNSLNVPFYKSDKNVLFFSINEAEIAVLKLPSKLPSDRNEGNAIPVIVECERINILNLNPQQIRSKILEI